MVLAITSLPTPLSPAMTTFASEGAIAPINSSISCIGLLLKIGAGRASAISSSFSKQKLFLQRFLHAAQKFLRRIRLADEMVSAAFDRLDGVMQRVVRCQNN